MIVFLLLGLQVCISITGVISWTIPTLLSHGQLRQRRHRVHSLTHQLLSTTAATNTATTTTNNDNTQQQQGPLEYNWKQQWYALTYANNVPDPAKSANVVACAVFGEPLVVWRETSGKDSPIYCANDVCSHRQAALSEGRVRNGTLQCLYHGWQFSGSTNGQCVRIPQLEYDATSIPKRANIQMKKYCIVNEGIVWVWMDDECVPTRTPPCTGVIDNNGKGLFGWYVYDFMIDLPYDHTYLVENLLDPAHIAISHDRTSGGGRRESAAPYEMYVNQSTISSQGFIGQYRVATKPTNSYSNSTTTKNTATKEKPFIEFQYEAPGIVRNKFKQILPFMNSNDGNINNNKKEKDGIEFCAALHCMPITLGRCRLFFRVYNRNLPWFIQFIVQLKPLWYRHLNSCKVLEQDVGLITTQEDYFARNINKQYTLQKKYLLLQSSDTFVSTYRQWLDRVGHGMPWFQGLALSSIGTNPLSHVQATTILPPSISIANHRGSNSNIVETRYHRHVQHSYTTLNALHTIQKLKLYSIIISLVSLTISCAIIPHAIHVVSKTSRLITSIPQTILLMRILRTTTITLPIACIATIVLHLLEQQFFVSYKRKDDLRRDSGLVP